MGLKQKKKIIELLSKLNEKILLDFGIRSISMISEVNYNSYIYIDYLEHFEKLTEEELILKLENIILKIREDKLKRILKRNGN